MYCQAMTDADIDTLRKLTAEGKTYTHMSGKKQTREEYFDDIADGSLTYYTIGIADPVIKVNGDSATITYTSVLNANAYGARGTFRMKGTHSRPRKIIGVGILLCAFKLFRMTFPDSSDIIAPTIWAVHNVIAD
jgi:hypothetical protein